MAPNHHRKPHFARETTDAFAEGWDAREQAISLGRASEKPVNPYRVELEVIEELHCKRSAREVEGMKRDAEMWDQGWRERMEEERMQGA